jgi:DNA-binding HxlR family transcriptional regulator
MKKIIRRSQCGISSTLDILGDKWSFLIIRDMLFFRKNTYGDFLRSQEKIATNILADRLVILESEGFITKELHPGNKSKHLYQLTTKGLDLLPVLLEIMLWSDRYFEMSERGKALVEKIRENKNQVMQEIYNNLKQ